MKPYADTNFLTRCYLLTDQLPAPAAQIERLNTEGLRLPVIWLHRLEVPNAFELHVFASRTLGQTRVTPETAAAANTRFEDDCRDPASFLRQTIVTQSDLERQFQELSLRHTAKHGFRTYDLLHVTSALLLNCDTFWSFDPKANKLAKLEGLATLDEKQRR
ncbi:MAG: type II toxin-antitoxin system VapC family toxin [Verrucomicrobia bacterium]|nr:type II toxin-antitoxin system VapC family toxin [Verrucomicrobiota bacterium]